MKTTDLVAQFREETDDMGQQAPMFRTTSILRWLSEAQDEAAMRKRLLFEATNPDMCEVPVSIGLQSYQMHDRWWLITAAWLQDDGCARRHAQPLVLRSRESLDAWRPNWRTETWRTPFAATHEAGTTLNIAGMVQRNGTLWLEGYRLPMCPLTGERDDAPEIQSVHHRHLVDWAQYRGYSIPDREVHNPGAAKDALARFEDYFGPAVDADLRRDMQQDQHHHNRAWY